MRLSAKSRSAVTAGYLLTLSAVSLLPQECLVELPPLLAFADKVVHFMLYGLLALLLYWTCGATRANPRTVLAGTFAFCLAHGSLLEFLQGALPGVNRTTSLWDVLANMAGALAATPVWAAESRRFRAPIARPAEPRAP